MILTCQAVIVRVTPTSSTYLLPCVLITPIVTTVVVSSHTVSSTVTAIIVGVTGYGYGECNMRVGVSAYILLL